MFIKTKAVLVLLAVSMMWGLAFPMNRWALLLTGMDPFAFAGIRSLFATAAFLPFAVRGSGTPPVKRGGGPQGRLVWLWAGLATGTLLATYSVLEYLGLVYATSGKSGFIGDMYIVFVPLMAMASGRIPGRNVWAGLCLALFGLWLISDPGGAGSFNRGDVLTLMSAVFMAGHVMATARFANRVDTVRFVTVQLALNGLASLGISAARGSLPGAQAFWLTLPAFLFGILSLALGTLAQTEVQKVLRASEVALMLQLQGAFAAVFGMIFLDEAMTTAMWAGAALVVAGAVVAQRTPPRRNETVLADRLPRRGRGCPGPESPPWPGQGRTSVMAPGCPEG